MKEESETTSVKSVSKTLKFGIKQVDKDQISLALALTKE